MGRLMVDLPVRARARESDMLLHRKHFLIIIFSQTTANQEIVGFSVPRTPRLPFAVVALSSTDGRPLLALQVRTGRSIGARSRRDRPGQSGEALTGLRFSP